MPIVLARATEKKPIASLTLNQTTKNLKRTPKRETNKSRSKMMMSRILIAEKPTVSKNNLADTKSSNPRITKTAPHHPRRNRLWLCQICKRSWRTRMKIRFQIRPTHKKIGKEEKGTARIKSQLLESSPIKISPKRVPRK